MCCHSEAGAINGSLAAEEGGVALCLTAYRSTFGLPLLAHNRYQVQWPCCLQKGLPYRLMKPNHHTNVSLSPLESEIIEEQ